MQRHPDAPELTGLSDAGRAGAEYWARVLGTLAVLEPDLAPINMVGSISVSKLHGLADNMMSV